MDVFTRDPQSLAGTPRSPSPSPQAPPAAASAAARQPPHLPMATLQRLRAQEPEQRKLRARWPSCRMRSKQASRKASSRRVPSSAGGRADEVLRGIQVQCTAGGASSAAPGRPQPVFTCPLPNRHPPVATTALDSCAVSDTWMGCPLRKAPPPRTAAVDPGRGAGEETDAGLPAGQRPPRHARHAAHRTAAAGGPEGHASGKRGR